MWSLPSWSLQFREERLKKKSLKKNWSVAVKQTEQWSDFISFCVGSVLLVQSHCVAQKASLHTVLSGHTLSICGAVPVQHWVSRQGKQ